MFQMFIDKLTLSKIINEIELGDSKSSFDTSPSPVGSSAADAGFCQLLPGKI